MAPVLAVALSLLIVEPDMPQRKSPTAKTAAAKPAAAKARHQARARRQAKARRRARPDPAAEALLATLNPHAAGLDIGASEIWACFPEGVELPPPVDHPDGLPLHVRCFGTYTAELERLADLLLACGVDTVAMESTGVYWIPIYDLLQSRGLHVLLADSRQTHDTPGRPKTDVKDCMWIQRLHSLGLLRAAFRPDEGIRVWRSYQRHRANLVVDAARFTQRLQKALEQMNVKLTEVVSDVTGVTGMAILRAIVAGERDPQILARFRQPHCKNDAATIALALEGTWRPEHLLELRQCLELRDYFAQKVAEVDAAIEEHLRGLALPEKPAPLPPPQRAPRQRHRNEPHFDARQRLYELAGVDLTAIEGIDAGTASVVLSEVGTNMERFANEKKFGAWLGLAPNPRRSGGKTLSAKTRPGVNRAAQALRLAARSLMRSKSALGAFLRRIAARRGVQKAITATAYKLARIIYGMLKHGSAYVRQEMEQYEEQHRQRQLRLLQRKAKEMGYELVEKEPAAKG